ncbi:hypothetical protein ACXR2U_00955 [Jatrophihabitans sp. YIM 134969]
MSPFERVSGVSGSGRDSLVILSLPFAQVGSIEVQMSMSVDSHSRRLALLTVRETEAGRGIDLRSAGWLDPLHLVCVASAAHDAHVVGTPFELLGPQGDQARYAARMRLGHVLDRVGARHDLPEVRERDRADVLTELTALQRPADVRAMATLVYDKVAAFDADTAAGLHNSLAEISANVHEHSGTIGFVAAQTIPAQGVIRFAVADAGVGMLATLRTRGATDARTAIAMALSGASSLTEATHGRGLPSVLRDVGALGGQLVVASGDALTAADRNGRTHQPTRAWRAGTVLEGWVPLAQARHASTLPAPR